jgi:hypothetical protein
MAVLGPFVLFVGPTQLVLSIQPKRATANSFAGGPGKQHSSQHPTHARVREPE